MQGIKSPQLYRLSYRPLFRKAACHAAGVLAAYLSVAWGEVAKLVRASFSRNTFRLIGTELVRVA